MTEFNTPTPLRLINKPSTLQPEKVMALWRARPRIFYEDVMDVKLDPWQEDCVELYLNNQRLGLVASKGPGKTFLLAMLGWHFFITSYQPKLAALSISEAHLKSNLWAELLKWRARSQLLSLSTNEGNSKITLKGHEGYSFIDARSYPKMADNSQMASALAGLHADNVGFLIDEAGMIPDAVLATADAALSGLDAPNKKARLLVTANPEEPQGMLYRAYMKRTVQKWAIYTISGDPDDPKRAPRVSRDWALEQIETYGRDNPWVLVNVFGKYPEVSNDRLISEEEVFRAMNRTIEEREVAGSQLRLGVDVARGGVDNTAMASRRGLKAYPLELLSSSLNGHEVASRIAFMQQERKIERAFVDNTGGYGSSVIDSLQHFPHLDVTPVVYNAKAQDKRYYNKRTEMWVRMRDWIKNGGCLPNDPQLAEEILMPKIFFNGGVFRLEEKEQIKSRLKRSPDRADALAQTFADVEQPSFFADYSGNGGKPEHEYYDKYSKRRQHIADEDDLDTYFSGRYSNHKS